MNFIARHRRVAQFCMLVLGVASLRGADATQATESRLWYSPPAQRWDAALPIGNGRLAAMAFGTFPRDRLQVNEETIWEGTPIDRCNPQALAALPQLRAMLFNGQNAEAGKLIDRDFVSPRRHLDPYQTAGELLVDFVGHGSAPATGPWIINPKDGDPNPWISAYGLMHYARDLDLATGITTSHGTFEHVRQEREAFVSWADDLI